MSCWNIGGVLIEDVNDANSHFCSCLQVTGKCGSVLMRLIPAPRGTGIVSAPVPKKLLAMAGVEDCYTSAKGQTATLGNFGKYLIFYYYGS